VPIDDTATAGELRAQLARAGAALLVEHLPRIASTTPRPQTGEPTYAQKLTVDEFALDPGRPAAELARVVRAGNPRPGAWFTAAGRRYKVWRAHATAQGAAAPGVLDARGLGTADGTLAIDEIQPEGKRRMAYADWWRGAGPVESLAVEPA
jgi:methionyl-tRNA formyltransferase